MLCKDCGFRPKAVSRMSWAVSCPHLPGIPLNPYKDGCDAFQAVGAENTSLFDSIIEQQKRKYGLLPPEKKTEPVVAAPQPVQGTEEFKPFDIVKLKGIRKVGSFFVVLDHPRHAHDGSKIVTVKRLDDAFHFPCEGLVANNKLVDPPRKVLKDYGPNGNPAIKKGSYVLVCESLATNISRRIGMVYQVTKEGINLHGDRLLRLRPIDDYFDIFSWTASACIYLCDENFQ